MEIMVMMMPSQMEQPLGKSQIFTGDIESILGRQ